MKRKRLSAVLGCLLALTMLAGFAVPLVGSAATYDLTVLNPKADFEVANNMQLADRTPLLNKLTNKEPIELLLLFYGKFENVDETWGLAHTVKDQWVEEFGYENPADIKLTGIWNNGTIGGLNTSRNWKELGITPPLGTPWGTKSGKNYIDGMPMSEEPFERYQEWSSFDAVIFGVADCNVCTWWSSYHAQMIESRGTPVAVISSESYENTQFYSTQDNGFTRNRRVVFDEGYKTLWDNVGRGSAPYNYTENNATEANTVGSPKILEMKRLMKLPPVSKRLISRADKTFNDSTDSMKWMDFDIWQMASKSCLEQAQWALLGPRTAADINPAPSTGVSRGALDWKTKTFSASSESEAIWMFNKYAMDENIGDGMTLIPPTQELVDEMLAGTTRHKDDILGTLKMRSGIITVEKVAILGVMAGCKPEYMPILVAAAEILGNSAEEDFTWWHPMTSASGGLGIILLVSGPIAEQIGMTSNVGEMGAGNPVNNTIGRAFRLMFRNFAHNLTPDIDTNGYGTRLSDRTMFAVAENLSVIREIGWESHSEIMGFGDDSDSVTLIATDTAPHTQATNGAFNTNWTPANLANLLGNGVATPQLFGTACVNVVAYSPAQARLVKDTYPTKQALMTARQDSVASAAGSLERASFQFPIVIGDDPGGAYRMNSSYYVATGYQSQKVTGATKTAAGSTATAPSAPKNFSVIFDATAGRAALNWDAPLSDGGSPITGYQVYYFDGAHDMAWRWLDVPGGATARSCYFTNLQPGIQYFFKVRAINAVDNARYFINSGGDANMSDTPTRGPVRYAKDLFATPLARTAGEGGAAYAASVTMPGPSKVLSDNQYPQLNGQPIKLYWGYPLNNGADERYYGPGTIYDADMVLIP